MQMLAVNGKVSGYCVHLPVCNLQMVKSTEKVSCLWEQLFPSTYLSKLSSSLSRCPSSMKSGVGVYEDSGASLTTGQPCLSLNSSPQSLHPVQLFGRHSWLKSQPKQAKLCANCHKLDPPTVWLATQAKSVKMVKTFFPWELSPCWLGDGHKKN